MISASLSCFYRVYRVITCLCDFLSPQRKLELCAKWALFSSTITIMFVCICLLFSCSLLTAVAIRICATSTSTALTLWGLLGGWGGGGVVLRLNWHIPVYPLRPVWPVWPVWLVWPVWPVWVRWRGEWFSDWTGTYLFTHSALLDLFDFFDLFDLFGLFEWGRDSLVSAVTCCMGYAVP